MPNRIIREGILASRKVNELTPEEEVFYRRLMQVADDYGRYYAEPGLLRAALYPRKLETITRSQVESWLAVCAAKDLVAVYEVDNEKYLEIWNFNQQIRSVKSKFPPPNKEKDSRYQMISNDIRCAADAQQMISNAHLDVSVSEGVSVVEDACASEGAKTPPPPTSSSETPAPDAKREGGGGDLENKDDGKATVAFITGKEVWGLAAQKFVAKGGDLATAQKLWKDTVNDRAAKNKAKCFAKRLGMWQKEKPP